MTTLKEIKKNADTSEIKLRDLVDRCIKQYCADTDETLAKFFAFNEQIKEVKNELEQ